MDNGLQRALRIAAGILGLLLSLPLAIAAYGVSVFISSDSGAASGVTGPVLVVTVAVALVALVLFVGAIRTLFPGYASRLTLFVVGGCEAIALVLFVLAIRAGSNLVFWAVLAGVAVVISVLTGLRLGQRQAAA